MMKFAPTTTLLLALLLAGSPALAQEGAPGDSADQISQEYAQRLGPPTELEELIEYARENAPEARRAEAEVGLGEAAREGAERLSRHNPAIEGEFKPGLSEGTGFGVEVKLTQQVELFGERGLRREAAGRQVERREAELDRARWEVESQVRRRYQKALVAREHVEVARQAVGFADEMYEMAAEREELGEGPRTSVVMARADAAGARQELIEAWSDYMAALRELSQAAGWREDVPPQPVGEPPQVTAIDEPAQLVERAVERDPQLALIEAERAEARADLALAERSAWPDPLFGVGYESESPAVGDSEHVLLVIAGIELPFWDRNQGEVAATNARAEILERAGEGRKTTLKNRVLEHAETVENARLKLRLYREQVLPAFEENLELLSEGFELGEMDLTDVLTARDRLLDVQRAHLDALGDYVEARSQLQSLVGE